MYGGDTHGPMTVCSRLQQFLRALVGCQRRKEFRCADAHEMHTLGILNRVSTHTRLGRYDCESDLPRRSARMETEGGPPTTQKCRVVEFNGNARKASEKAKAI
jgi:hypothetical protein